MIELHIVIVHYNTRELLERCLHRIHEETSSSFRITVIDNHSRDRNFDGLQRRFPRVQFLLNERNLGFSKACNQGLRAEDSPFHLLLNPDCMIEDHATDKCLAYLRQAPSVGILGCKVKNPDGTLQKACRRRIPDPKMAFYRFSGLSTLFPKSRRFAAYNLAYQDENTIHEVEAVSGSFLMLRTEVLQTSGYFDESFFLYGEDLDFCYRAHQAGWKILYYPEAEATHLKRSSSSQQTWESNVHFYEAMRIFYLKHFAPQAGRLEQFAVMKGIALLHFVRRLQFRLLGKTQVGSSD